MRHGYEFPNLKTKEPPATAHVGVSSSSRPAPRHGGRRGGARHVLEMLIVEMLAGVEVLRRSSVLVGLEVLAGRRSSPAWRCSPAWMCFAGRRSSSGRARQSSVLAGVEVLCRLKVSSRWRCSPAVTPRRRGGARRPPVLVGVEVDAMVEVLTDRRGEGRQYGGGARPHG